MAYEQGGYHQPSRPYNGRATAPPSQAYSQGAYDQQQYHAPAQGQYDQYAQDPGYGYNQEGYDNGYSQQDYGQQQQPMNGGGRGGDRGYPQQRNAYAPPGDNYAYGGSGGGHPPPPRSGVPPGRGGPDGRDQGRGGGPSDGRSRPNGMDRPNGSTPGGQPRKLLVQPISPEVSSYDNPFPSFPGASKKTSISEEQKIISNMAAMEVGGGRRPGTAGGQRRPPPQEGYPRRPSMDSQRGAQRGPAPGRGPPPQGPQGGYRQRAPPGQGPGPGPGPRSQSRGPPPGRINTYGPANSDPYGQGQSMSPTRGGYGGSSRSNTMPNDVHPPPRQQSDPRYAAGDVGPSAPYNGSAGRVPPRPSTAGSNRPPPTRMYAPEPVPQQAYGESGLSVGPNPDWKKSVHIEHLYDDYFDRNEQQRDSAASYDTGPYDHQKALSLEGPTSRMPPRQQVNDNPAMSRMKSQPDFRAQIQPQSAVYEMAGDAPPVPGGFAPQQGGYDQQYDQYDYDPQNGQGISNADGYGYDQGGQQQGYRQPNDASQQRNMPLNGPGPGPGTNGNGARSNGNPGSDALPSHPPPVRAGLVQKNPTTNLANNKPAPVRNYGTPPVQATPVNLPPLVQRQPTAVPVVAPAPVTPNELEQLRRQLKSQPNDAATHLTFARKLMEAADILVPQIPDARRRAKEREKYVLEAHKILKRLSSGPHPHAEAQFFLADCLGRGALGLEPDNKEAFTLYQGAAKLNHAAAAYRTAVCCELGNEEGGGTRKDPEKAIQWYKRAATLGDTPAMYKMGIISLKGLLGQQRNIREAVAWLKRAADHADAENPHALHELGLLFEAPQPANGSSPILQDEAYALSLFQQSAKLGYKFSQYRLGCAYEYGLFNLPISPRDSIMWYSRAAVQEEHQSELALSGWYLTGSEGILGQSDTEAYLWARKSATAGLAKAEYAMGYYTEVGIGAPCDLEAAKRWYWRAAAQNFPQARVRLEELKKGGSKPAMKTRERHSRSRIGKADEGECAVM